MKTSTKVLANLNQQELETLTTQVAETLATDNCNKKTFTSLNLWSIQKQRKTYGIRRFA